MNYKSFFTIAFIILQLTSFSQEKEEENQKETHPFYGGAQIGGQNVFSLFHEFEFLSRSQFKLHSNLVVGINNAGKNSADVQERGIYGVQAGILGLIGKKSLVAELGVMPSVYSYKVAFVNVNAWAGVRLTIETTETIFISLGYTPCVFKTYSDPDNRYQNVLIGGKFGVNF
ncbi:MAG TPA: hypothetical protein VFF27_07270 [Bacteroidia bacterium]|jgi:hypothetical protein|nr:hypothetical protein [Bacteroidia bacterium]